MSATITFDDHPRLSAYSGVLTPWGMHLEARPTPRLSEGAQLPAAAWSSASEEGGQLEQAALLVPMPDRERVVVSGADRVKFLQGLLTNDVRLTPGTGCLAAMLTVKGKLQFDVRVHARGDDFLFDLPFGYGGTAVASLDRYLFREKVTLTDQSDVFAALLVAGPRAAQALGDLDVEVPKGPFGWASAAMDGIAVDITGSDMLGEREAFVVWAPTSSLELVAHRLRGAVEAVGGALGDFDALERARVRAGVPRFGVDMGPDTIPLETPLAHMVSFDKGCYLGQEVIARVDSRGAVARHLVMVKTERAPALGSKVQAAGEDKVLGQVTSTAPLLDGGWVALAWVKRGHQEPGTAVLIEGTAATVVG